jgi:hypothetical protein
MGVGRCLGLEVLEEGGFGASQEGWLLVVMLLIIIFYFAIYFAILPSEEEEEEEPYLLKLHVLYCTSLLGLFLYPCTLPTAPVSRSFGLRFSYESVIFDTD